MNEDKIEGAVKKGAGRLKAVAGDYIGDDDMVSEGEALQVEGGVQSFAGAVQETIEDLAETVRARLLDITAQAREAFAQASSQVETVSRAIEPAVQERPFASLAAATFVGFVVGLAVAGSRSQVIYVRPRG